MLLIPCPWCGKRDEVEFRYGGQAGITLSADAGSITDEELAELLYMRDNPKGVWRERWFHAAGCRRWFEVERDTATYRISGSWRPAEGNR
jgi:heterotetrameric sarcosine oxidase delta subunit